MSIILDARPQFLDSVGVRLSLGRLVIYKASTTTLADVWLDNEHTVPALNPYQLTDAGWTDRQLFIDEAVTVHVQDYLNADVKIYDLYQDGTIAVFGSAILVDTIADLADVALPVDGMTVQVKGYYSAHDLFVRTYIFDAISTSTPDGGAIIGSNVQPTGRWLLANDSGEVDAGVWGVLAGVASVNSQLRAAQEFCALRGLVLRISKGLYTLVGGGTYASICQLNVQKGASFSCTGGIYDWTLQNPMSVITSTLAGSGVHLVLDGKGWENTVVPDTAWGPIEAGYDDGTAVFRLRIATTEQLIFNNPCEFASIEVDDGVTAVIACDDVVSIGKITGLVDWSQSTRYPMVRDLVTSTATTSATAGELMCKCSGIVTLDSVATLPTGGTVTAYVNAIGDGKLTWGAGAGCTLSGGFGGRDRFITGPDGINSGASEVSGKYFNAGNVVGSFNVSTSAPAYLDLMGLSAVGNVTRNGKIINGQITGNIQNTSIILDGVTLIGYIQTTSIRAERCAINSPASVRPVSASNSELKGVTLNVAVPATTSYMQAHNATWEDVSYNHVIQSSGGSAHLRNVSCSKLIVSPDSTNKFGNFTYGGGSISENIVYDAANWYNTGESIMYNVSIKDITGLATAGYGDVLNGPTKKWAINGHYNVDVSGNERGLSTRGAGVFPLVLIEGAWGAPLLFYVSTYEKILFLGPNSITEHVTNCEPFANVYKDGDIRRSYSSSVIHSLMGRSIDRQFSIGANQIRIDATGNYSFAPPTHCSFNWRLYL